METPEIEFWYGDVQSFGSAGNPQRWVNVLGTVHGPVRSLCCSLNGGEPRPLSLGPDGLRLQAAGDFNAEFPVRDLREGANTVELTATAEDGREVAREMIVEYTPDRRWPLPCRLGPDGKAPLMDGVQIVDGRWELDDGGIRPAHPHYDRLVAVGDREWTDYRLRVTATVHGFSERESGLTGGFGLLFRWTGHYPDEHQPHREWRPSGAIGWYRARWEERPPRVRSLNISDGVVRDIAVAETNPIELTTARPHVFEFGVRSRPGRTSKYRYRVWPDGEPDRPLCDLTAEGREGESPRGSALIIALYCDVTIHDIEADPL